MVSRSHPQIGLACRALFFVLFKRVANVQFVLLQEDIARSQCATLNWV